MNNAWSITTPNFEFKVSFVHDLIENKNWKCTDIINYFHQRAYKYNPKIHAIINFNPNAIAEAISIDDNYRVNKKLVGRLHCIPILVKDIIDVQSMPTTGGIKALRNSVPNKNAVIIDRLKNEGAIVLAKANLAEMAFSEYNSETGGECKNPWDTTRTCSRSSSGSGAGIAAGMAVISIGTDTDGSIMGPASVNGIFGLRPPIGQVDMNGIIPLLDKDDTVGPMAQYMDDLVLAHSIMAANNSIYDIYANSKTKTKRFKIGYLKKFLEPFNVSSPIGTLRYTLDDEVYNAMINSIGNFRKLNVDIVELNTSISDMVRFIEEVYGVRYYNCAIPCYKTSLNRYFSDSLRFESDAPYHSFDDLRKTDLLSSFFKEFLNVSNVDNPIVTCYESCKPYDAQKITFQKIVESWFKISDKESFDTLLFPTMVTIPEELTDLDAASILSPTFIAALSGYATISIPVSLSKPKKFAPDGLPIGAMLLSPNQSLTNMFSIAKMYETNYIKDKKLPSNTPLLKQICKELNYETNNGLTIKLSVVIMIFLSLSTLFMTNNH